MASLVTVTTSAPATTVVVTEPAPVVRVDAVIIAPETVSVSQVEKVVIDHPGTQGIPGPTGGPGESAYQLAVDLGFDGTEAEWLASLVGPTGPTAADAAIAGTYVYQQVNAATSWVVVHNLGFHPNVTTVDSADTRIEGDVSYLDINTVVVTFSVPIGGRAFLS